MHRISAEYTAITGENVALLASVASEEAPPIVFNAQMRSDIEVPACATESQGHAQIKIFQDGRIESTVILNNKGMRVSASAHSPPEPRAGTGPIIWWLSSPVGVDLNLTERHIDVRQDGIFVANPHFATHAAGLAELLANPGNFYVNFHSITAPAASRAGSCRSLRRTWGAREGGQYRLKAELPQPALRVPQKRPKPQGGSVVCCNRPHVGRTIRNRRAAGTRTGSAAAGRYRSQRPPCDAVGDFRDHSGSPRP